MDVLLCLLGVCDAVAQVAEGVSGLAADVAADAADATAAGDPDPDPDPDPEADADAAGSADSELSLALTWFGIVVVVLAQAAAPQVLARYRKRLTGFMASASREALGLRATDELRWDADTLLAAMERQRRAVLRVLVGVVVLYSLAAALIYGWQFDNRLDHVLSLSVSFGMFAAFSGPIVLLGVSASNFARLFWTWFGPAAFAAAAMQTIIAAIDGDAERSAVLWALAGVLLLTVVAVAVREWAPPALWPWLRARRGRVALAALVGFGVLLGALAPDDVDVRSEAFEAFLKLLLGCTIALVAIALCYLTLVDRTKRIVVPLLAAAMLAATVAFVVFVAAGVAAFEPATGGTVALVLLGLVVGWLTASFLLSWIGLAYAQKLFSDAQFQVFCWMVTVAGVVICVETLTNDEPLWGPLNVRLLGATALALLAYWALTRYGIKPLPTNKRLLVLRVFAQDRRGERLLDELEYRWRFIGPIVLIGANDVAGRTIDPAKAADFLRGRLKNTFVPDSHALHKRVAAIDEAPDPDGRYRVNEFFCFDDTWKEAVQLLLESSDAIVLDLSGFTAERRGTAYELGLLKERGALARTVFLVSAQTDLGAVRAALHLAPDAALPVGSVLEVDQRLDGGEVVAALVHSMPGAGCDRLGRADGTPLTPHPASR